MRNPSDTLISEPPPAPAPATAPPASSRHGGTYDAIVIGAGVLGAFHVYSATRAGLRTLLIERGEMPTEASVRNFGTLVASAMTPGEWHELAVRSAAIWTSLAPVVPFTLKRGTQYLATTPRERTVLEEFASIAPNRGYRCDLLDAGRSHATNTAIRPDACLASLLFPDDLRVESRRALPALVRWLAGETLCTYLPRTVAVRAEAGASARGGRCRVTTAGGLHYLADRVFVCTGGDFRTLFPERFESSGLIRCKLTMLRTAPQRTLRMPTTLASGLSIRWYPSFQMCPSWHALAQDPTPQPLFDRGIHVLMVQDDDGRVMIGDSHAYSAGDFSDVLDSTDEDLILQVARGMAQLDDWRIEERWPGVYPLHPDRPIYTETIDERIHVVTGIGGKGMTTGPAVAARSVATVFALDPNSVAVAS